MNKFFPDKYLKVVWIIVFIVLILLFARFIFNHYKGSNADLPSTPDAKLICRNVGVDNVTITWEYPYLNETDSLDAFNFASENACEFWHSRFKLNESKGGK
jgi:hypothetical protein